MLVLLFACTVVGAVLYWLGRGTSLNQHLRAMEVVERTPGINPDALVNLKTGEVIEPGTRKYARAERKSTVRFEE